MTRSWLVVGAALAGVLATGGAWAFLAAEAHQERPKAGEMAPPLQGTDQHGKLVNLADFRGQKDVVLYFYPKDGTPGCTAQACSLRDGYRAIEAAGAVVIGVSADSARSHEEFASKHNLPFSILADPDKVIIRRYGVAMPVIGISKRVTFLIGKDGVVRRVITDTRTKDHDLQVLDALRKLGQKS